jgi:ketosteroid isomerase-like protein
MLCLRLHAAPLLIALATSSVLSAQSAAPKLMKADRDFAAAVAAHGVDAWVAAFAADGIQIDEAGVTQGSAAIRHLMTGALADPKVLLDWQPVSAVTSASADLGYTIGKWQVRSRAHPDSVFSHGNYVTIWRKQPDGSWKAAVDIGNPEK